MLSHDRSSDRTGATTGAGRKVRKRELTGVPSSDSMTPYSSHVVKARCLHPLGEDGSNAHPPTAQSSDTLWLVQRCSLRSIFFLWHLWCFCSLPQSPADNLLASWVSAILHGESLGTLWGPYRVSNHYKVFNANRCLPHSLTATV